MAGAHGDAVRARHAPLLPAPGRRAGHRRPPRGRRRPLRQPLLPPQLRDAEVDRQRFVTSSRAFLSFLVVYLLIRVFVLGILINQLISCIMRIV